jgi:hypothetical protein
MLRSPLTLCSRQVIGAPRPPLPPPPGASPATRPVPARVPDPRVPDRSRARAAPWIDRVGTATCPGNAARRGGRGAESLAVTAPAVDRDGRACDVCASSRGRSGGGWAGIGGAMRAGGARDPLSPGRRPTARTPRGGRWSRRRHAGIAGLARAAMRATRRWLTAAAWRGDTCGAGAPAALAARVGGTRGHAPDTRPARCAILPHPA